MTEKKGYNGWTNYETWNVALWISNVQGSSEYWAERAQECYDNAKADKFFKREEQAAFNLGDELKNSFEENNPLNTVRIAGPYHDLLHAALSEVNWREIAESLIDANVTFEVK